MEKSKSEPYNIAQEYRVVWEAEFNDKFIVLPMHYKWAKELVGVPYDIIVERAKIHCRDLWHRQHCKGSLQCFVKNFNSFVDNSMNRSTKPKVEMVTTCEYCKHDFTLDDLNKHLETCSKFQSAPMNDELVEKLLGKPRPRGSGIKNIGEIL